MEELTRLPDITFLALDLMANGHSSGASSFHILRMCAGVRKLSLAFLPTPVQVEAEAVCPIDCICDQTPNWKTEKLALNCLQQVEIIDLKGTEHEIALLKRLFNWATVLKEVSVTFNLSVTESKADELIELLCLCREEVCMKFYTAED